MILSIVLLFIGSALAFSGRAKEKEKSNARTTTLGLVLFGLGGFGLLTGLAMSAQIAGIAIVAVLLAVGWAIERSLTGMVHGIIAIVIIVVIGLIFSLSPASDWLLIAATDLGDLASRLGGVVASWLPESQ